MKQLLGLAALLSGLAVQAQIKMPAPSTTQQISQDFGMGKLLLSYSRPNLKERPPFKENGTIAPMGKVWRTGANAATTLTVTDEISINGVVLKAGKYGLLSVPEKKQLVWIVTKDTTVTSPAAYKPDNDIVRLAAPYTTTNFPTETLSFQFGNVQNESCQLQLSWSKYVVTLPIATNIKARIAKQVETALAADKISAGTYQTAANFYFEWEKDLPKALVNATKATEANGKAFWLWLLKARIAVAMGDKISAKADAEKCIALATEQKNGDYVKMATDLIKGL